MKKLKYEDAFQELQSIVRQLEEESIGIDELSGKVQRAAELIRLCREKLRQTGEEIDGLFEDK
jgi:exodeoxyribonuclease VII small subunit